MSSNPRILSVATALPPYRVSREETKDFARRMFSGAFRDIERIMPAFDNAGVESRYLCVPVEWLEEEHTFPERNALYVESTLELSEKAAWRAMDRAGASPDDVGAIFFVSTSGIAAPTLDSKLMFMLGLPENTRRVPIWGLGCAGGASGLSRAAEHARLYPQKLVLLIVAEPLSFTFQPSDRSKSNLISTSLFADGISAVIVGGEPDGGPDDSLDSSPEVIGSYSTTWPGTEDVMGWDLIETGLKVQLSRSVPEVVRERMRGNLDDACTSLGLDPAELRHFVMHPGGAKVLDAFEEVLDLQPGGLVHSRSVLRECGNMSSATVLFILERFLHHGEYASGDLGLLTAMGPGFSAEHVFFRC